MFIVTFYSYKGGVGRSLALANVAAELAQRGKSVLVVDFDLEAPGASSFQFNACKGKKSEQGGIIEFVLTWLQDNVSPDVRNFVYECKSSDPSHGSIWVMPAGQLDASYGTRLHQIDFHDLYDNHDGFLLVEDLKAQWRETLKVDYVLVDSRTGHTDIGGICTRQLPDLVTFVFWPNSQNLDGLSYIVQELNAEEKEVGRSIDRLFVPSNLPTLDDEEEVLKRLLEKFQVALKYDRSQELRLQHYPSLELLEQKIFTAYRPNSRLGREYRRLTDAIQRRNLDDEDGVRLFLERVVESFARYDGSARYGEMPFASERDQKQLEEIYLRKWGDPKVNRLLGILRAREGDFAQAIQLVEGIISAKKATLPDYFLLASWLMSSGAGVNPKEAIVDPRETIDRLLDDQKSGQKEVLAAIRLIAKFELQPEYKDNLLERQAVRALTGQQLARVCNSVDNDEFQTRLVADIVYKFVTSMNTEDAENLPSGVPNRLSLCLIAAGYYTAALNLLHADQPRLKDGFDKTANAFNSAIAAWGRDGLPSLDLFAEVVSSYQMEESKKYENRTNYNQCLALCYGVLEERETALAYLAKARKLIDDEPGAFSCWTYLQRGQIAFVSELDEMKSWILSGSPPPRFLERYPNAQAMREEKAG